mgnify:CR=1 FL=1
MNLEEWRKRRQQGEDATLPSGLTVQLRQVSMLDLAAKGEIPQTLKPQIDALMQGGNKVKDVTLDGLYKFVGVIDLVVGACLAGPEGLAVDELSYGDKVAIFNWANEASGKLQPFRREQAQPVGA